MRDTWQEQCRAEVKRVLAKRGWTLASNVEEFAAHICYELEPRWKGGASALDQKTIERATMHQYCFVLHAACGEKDSARQQRAFEELWPYLNQVARFKTHRSDVAEECAQQALENIWRHLDQCQDPGRFLNWCNLILVNVIRDHYRKNWTRIETDEGEKWVRKEIGEGELETEGAVVAGSPMENTDSTVETTRIAEATGDQFRARIITAIRTCLKNETHQKVIIETFLNNKTSKQLVEELQLKPNNIQVMKFRALRKLHDCPDFLRIYEQWIQ